MDLLSFIQNKFAIRIFNLSSLIFKLKHWKMLLNIFFVFRSFQTNNKKHELKYTESSLFSTFRQGNHQLPLSSKLNF